MAPHQKREQHRHINDTEAVNTVYSYTVYIQDGRPVETTHSDTCLDVTGYTSREFTDDFYLWIKMVVQEDRSLILHQARQVLSGDFPEAVDHRIVRKDGRVRWVSSSVFPNYDADNNLISYSGLIRDITARKKEERILRGKEERFKLAALAEANMIYDFDVEKGTINWTGNIDSYLGYSVGEFSDSPGKLVDIIHPDDRRKVMISYKNCIESGECNSFDYRIRRKDGTYRHLEEHAIPVFHKNKKLAFWTGTIRDITRNKEIEEQLRRASTVDQVTGLLNRQEFLRLAAHKCMLPDYGKSRKYLFYFGTDNLKKINDTFGYKVGDEALQAIAKILRDSFSRSDIIGRIGGDEFTVFVPDHSGPDTEDTITGIIRKNLNICNKRNGHRFTLSLSIGTACHDPEHPCSVIGMLAQAEASMHRNKLDRSKKNVIPFSKEKTAEERVHRRYAINGEYSAMISVPDNIRIKDISAGGMRLETSEYLNTCNNYTVRFLSPDGEYLTLTGEVVWSALSKTAAEKYANMPYYEAGLSFKGLDEKRKISLEKFIAGIEDQT